MRWPISSARAVGVCTGLVNNAGIGTVGSVADMKPEEFDLLMAVNLYGPYRYDQGRRTADHCREGAHHQHGFDFRDWFLIEP